tara:strand:- start:1700 stop:6994 length:5295 start_codon:yes stop_codon:yes gene_type:complete
VSNSKRTHQIAGYSIQKTVLETDNSIVFLGTHETKTAYLKLQKISPSSISSIARIQNEYTILKTINHLTCVPQNAELKRHLDSWVLIMPVTHESFSLKEFINYGKVEIKDFLNIAISLADALSRIHEAGIIHKDIKPENVVLSNQGDLKFIDFGTASQIAVEFQDSQNLSALEGTLSYISPELTRRMNRPVDYRTDFYSLGVLYYLMLTGKLPFTSEDPMELVYCHLAKQPKFPSEVSHEVPEVISRIVMKLMAKNSEDRYHSGQGLRKDLELCRQSFLEKGLIPDFEIASYDVPLVLTIPQKLYGREKQQIELIKAFEKSATGSGELVLVSGYSGIGKTVLVNELQKPIVKQKGYFISGKYNQYDSNIPYSAITQAFTSLVRSLLSESQPKIQNIKEKIISTLGENAGIIVDVIPELEHIIGPQSPIPPMSSVESKSRFYRTFQKFVSAFASAEHPLVIFLDDLQWADLSSLDLIKSLLLESSYFLLVGSYRENEVTESHPLTYAMNEIGKNKTVSKISLKPLQLNDMQQLLADTFHRSPEDCLDFAEVVIAKTGGNPFFASEFIRRLHKDGCVQVNTLASCWEWDISRIKSLEVTDNVVDLVTHRLKELSQDSQEILKIAACLGARFDLKTIAELEGTPLSKTVLRIWDAIHNGVVLFGDEFTKYYSMAWQCSQGEATETELEAISPYFTCRFLHDRVQQAAYDSSSKNEKLQFHLRIGRHFNQLMTGANQEYLLEAVNHLNQAHQLITEPIEIDKLVTLNLRAAQKSQDSTAYQAALEFVRFALALPEAENWNNAYERSFEFYLLGGRCCGLLGHVDEAEKFLMKALNNSQSPVDSGKIYAIRLNQLAAVGRYPEAITEGLKALELLGIHLPATHVPEDVGSYFMKEYQFYLQFRNEKGIQALYDLPVSRSVEHDLVISICASMLDCVFIAASHYYGVMAVTMINQTIRKGNTSFSPIGYQSIAIVLSAGFRNYDDAYELGALSLRVNDEIFKNKAISSTLVYVFATMFLPLKKSYQEVYDLYERAYKEGVDSGDQLFSAYAAVGLGRLSLMWSKKNLLSAVESFDKQLARVKKINNFAMGEMLASQKGEAMNFLGLTSSLDSIDYNHFNDTHYRDTFKSAPLFNTFSSLLLIGRLFHYGKFADASKVALESNFTAIESMILDQVTYRFFSAMAHAAYCRDADESEKVKLMAEFNKHRAILIDLSKSAPMNFAWIENLLSAELSYLESKDGMETVLKYYDLAIGQAKESGLIFFAALCAERAGRTWLVWGHEKIAYVYLADAYALYENFACKKKMALLQQEFPDLQTRTSSHTQKSFGSTQQSTSYMTSAMLDVGAIIKASQAISGEIIQEKLLIKLLQIAQENAGAQTACLILSNDGQVFVRAHSEGSGMNLVNIEATAYDKMAQSVFREALRTQEPVVLDQALTDSRYKSDPYIEKNKNKSILCMPILNHGRIAGYLYLENNLSSGAFSPDRVQVLKILASQAAVSLENASLYHDLEGRVQLRTQELNQSLVTLRETQAQLAHSSKMSALGLMAGGIAHEINTPLTTIRLHAERLEMRLEAKKLDAEMILKVSQSITKTVDHIAKIITGLRQFSRDGSSDPMVSVNVHEILDQTLALCQERFRKSNVIIECGHIDPQLSILGRPTEISQVILNLLNNSFDAIHEQKNSWIRIEAIGHDEGVVIFSLTDSGAGIDAKSREKLFQPFFTTKDIGKGTGLGLSISRGIIERHGGQLYYDETCANTRFIIRLKKADSIQGKVA